MAAGKETEEAKGITSSPPSGNDAPGGEGGSESSAGEKRRPGRYKIYDRIADNVSLTTMNVIVAVVALLLVFFVIYGIATGNPQG